MSDDFYKQEFTISVTHGDFSEERTFMSTCEDDFLENQHRLSADVYRAYINDQWERDKFWEALGG